MPKGYSAEQIIDILDDYSLDKALDYLPFVVPTATTIKNTKILSVVDESDADKVWKKTPEVLKNFKTLCAYIESLDKDAANRLVDILLKTPSEVSLNKGVICSAKKYVANCPDDPPKGATVIEIKVNSPDSAQYRVYGLLVDKTIHLLKAHTKNSGQEKADKVFDTFMKNANEYVKTIKFNESVSYNNIRGAKMKDDVFNELNEIYDIQCLENWAKGNNDAWAGKLCEDTADADYVRGYNSAAAHKKKVDEEDQFKENCRIAHEFYLAHKEEIEAKRKEIREKRK